MSPIAWLAFAAIAGELIGGVVLQSDAGRAAMSVGLVILAGSIGLVAGWGASTPKPGGRFRWFLVAILGAAGFALGLALLRANAAYYVVGDAYHVLFELVGMSFVGWTVARRSPGDVFRLVRAAAVLTIFVGLGAWALGTLGVPVRAGNFVPDLRIWRLDLGKGAPHVPLILLCASLVGRRRRETSLGLGLILALGLALVLVACLKRSLWLATLACLPLLLGASRRPKLFSPVGSLATVLAPLLLIVLVATPLGQDSTIVLDQLNYNRSYSTGESLLERQLQMVDAVEVIGEQPLGYGLGATVRVYDPEVRASDETHYLHNWFIFQIVQGGFVFGALSILAVIGVTLHLWNRSRRSNEARWVIVGAATALTLLLIAGSVMLSMHTVWAGLTIGLGVGAAGR